MTVPVPGSLSYTYLEDGVTTVFSYPVRFLEASELLVIREAADGVRTTMVYNTDYTVSGAGTANGGSITRTAVTSGGKIVIGRRTAAKQLVDLKDAQRNPAEAVELQLDRLAMVDQDHGERMDAYEVKTDAIDQAVVDSANNAAAAEAAANRAEPAADRAEAAASGIEGASVYSTKALAGAITPVTAPDFIRTAGYSSAGDGGGALYYSNGTTTGDLVITLSDRSTVVGYTVARDGIDVRALGIVADGSTDQTTALVAIIGALDTAGFRGGIHIPFSTKFTLATVYAAVDGAVGLALYDDSSINWHYTGSYKNKAIRVTYTGDLVDDDSFEMWASGHHPAIYLNNFGTAGTTSGDLRFATILHGAGVDPFGDYITGLYTQAGGDGSGHWRWGIFQSSPFDIATKVTEWFATTAYAVGAIVAVRATGYVYECTVAGTSSSTAPSHTSGTATDGTVTWKYRQAAIGGGGNTILQVGQNANLTQQSAVVGSHSIDDIIMIHPAISGGVGYQYHVIQDETAQCTTLKVPSTGALNLGSASKASVSTAGVTVYPTGSGGSTSMNIFNGASGGGPLTVGNTVAAAFTVVSIRAGGTQVGSISYSGSAVAYNTTSDAEWKIDDGQIEPIAAREVLHLIRIHNFRWKKNDVAAIGAFAQELYDVFPDAVEPGSPPEMLGDPEYIPWQVDYSKLVPVLVAGWQDLEARLAVLEAA